MGPQYLHTETSGVTYRVIVLSYRDLSTYRDLGTNIQGSQYLHTWASVLTYRDLSSYIHGPEYYYYYY